MLKLLCNIVTMGWFLEILAKLGLAIVPFDKLEMTVLTKVATLLPLEQFLMFNRNKGKGSGCTKPSALCFAVFSVYV